MVNNQNNGLVIYGLVISFPLRMALFAVHVYLDNLLALMQLIQDVQVLQLRILFKVIKWVYLPGPENGAALSLRFRTLKGLQIFLTTWAMMIHFTTQMWRMSCYDIMELSRLFRIYAESRTWTIMMQSHNRARR
ncbi:uncharacterized protein LOC122621486 [Drosophila teissieri]|uniref:uncharacterized protein LOC122621486 n=1 Tax=Drosophila teissieri TaxID=7243 RepID=UPI001CBA558A|nr:uncharacterized protein LOC122621486 [Drosophila teissieri]